MAKPTSSPLTALAAGAGRVAAGRPGAGAPAGAAPGFGGAGVWAATLAAEAPEGGWGGAGGAGRAAVGGGTAGGGGAAAGGAPTDATPAGAAVGNDGSLIVAVGLGGKLIRTVCFLASGAFTSGGLGGSPPGGMLGGFGSAIYVLAKTRVGEG